ncbi:hypothetical protein ACO2Q3_18765 [Caulobacter sp. KR2-114]|uniref:hypothetical protein n=1 Tax=Caulobacter sp. KR2-114 TaxID=3400912 RepID=UPI003C101836
MERRLRVFLGGKLAFVETGVSADCRIRNLSRSGAAVDLLEATAMPRGPVLIITKHARAHMTDTAWTCGRRAGLRLTRAWDLVEPGAAPAWMRRLWLDLAPR